MLEVLVAGPTVIVRRTRHTDTVWWHFVVSVHLWDSDCSLFNSCVLRFCRRVHRRRARKVRWIQRWSAIEWRVWRRNIWRILQVMSKLTYSYGALSWLSSLICCDVLLRRMEA